MIGEVEYLVGQNFRWTKFSTPSRNFDNLVRFLPDFCFEISDKIFDGQNCSSDKILDTKLKFRQFCPTNFCLIRYVELKVCQAQCWKWHFFDNYDVIIKQKSRLRIKLGRVVDSMEIYIQCENQEILQKLAVAKSCKITKKSDIDDVLNTSKKSDMPQSFLNNFNVSR